MSKILIVGYGSIGRRHHKNLLNYNKDFYFYILTRQKIKNNKKNTRFVKNIAEVKEKIDYLFICTGANEHLKYIYLFILKVQKIFVEKPLSQNSKGLIKLYQFCKKNKIKIFVGYNIIYLDSLLKLRQIIKTEKILKVSIKTNYDLRLWRKNIRYQNSVSASKNRGGGVLLELSHDIHYLLWLLGKPKWVSCYFSKLSNLKVDTEDNVILNIGFNKAISNIQMDFINKYYQRNLEILTNRNYYQWNYSKNNLMKFDQKTKKLKLIFKGNPDKNISYKNEISYFFNENNQKKINENLRMVILTSILIDTARKSKKNSMVKTYIDFKNV